VFDVHTLLESELPYYRIGLPDSLKRSVGRALDRRLPRHADHVIAVTDDIRSRLVNSGSVEARSISVIPNGVETAPFDSVGPSAPSDDPPTVIFTGNLAPYQGIDMMLEAFRAVRTARGDVRLLIATEDSFDGYENKASELGIRDSIHVERTDFSRVPGLLAKAGVALNPRTDCDGLPQKLLNYMAAGKPTVSFAGSAKHLRDGEHGLVVPDHDTQAFAQAIDRLLDDSSLARRLGAAARHLVRTTLSWDATAERVESAYEGLL
jgi:glycosyltransferase involved in cell wall biosynthesis